MTLLERIDRPGRKKILAIDGGGIRGHIAIEILAGLEDILGRKAGPRSGFVLSDYFDFITGTSTGAIIAAALAMGMSVGDIRALYDEHGKTMFTPNPWYKRLSAKYSERLLESVLKDVFGTSTTLGSDNIKSLLMIVTRNANTDSPWPLTNNPRAMFNARANPDGSRNTMCNLDIPLWMLIRASTAAPSYFRPEKITLGDTVFSFVDGGITPYNNPSFQSFMVATHPAYRIGWETGADKLLLVSVGTGSRLCTKETRRLERMSLLDHARDVPQALLQAINVQQDVLCRVFGKCLAGAPIDRELGGMHGDQPGIHGQEKLFTYGRYDIEISAACFQAAGLGAIDVDAVSSLDSIRHVDDLKRIGSCIRSNQVDASLFTDFPPEQA